MNCAPTGNGSRIPGFRAGHKDTNLPDSTRLAGPTRTAGVVVFEMLRLWRLPNPAGAPASGTEAGRSSPTPHEPLRAVVGWRALATPREPRRIAPFPTLAAPSIASSEKSTVWRQAPPRAGAPHDRPCPCCNQGHCPGPVAPLASRKPRHALPATRLPSRPLSPDRRQGSTSMPRVSLVSSAQPALPIRTAHRDARLTAQSLRPPD